jgi:hypothetical protein
MAGAEAGDRLEVVTPRPTRRRLQLRARIEPETAHDSEAAAPVKARKKLRDGLGEVCRHRRRQHSRA